MEKEKRHPSDYFNFGRVRYTIYTQNNKLINENKKVQVNLFFFSKAKLGAKRSVFRPYDPEEPKFRTKAGDHEDRGCAFVIVGDVWAWNILAESSINVDIETTHSKKQIENLDYWIGLVKNKVTRAYCSVDDPVSKTKSKRVFNPHPYTDFFR